MTHDIYLTASCPDQIGITAAVSQFMADKRGLIIDADHHTDLETQCFFMRYVVRFAEPFTAQQLSTAFAELATRFGMTYQCLDQAGKPRVLLMASREPHCIDDLLYHYQMGYLPCEIVGVVSNHRVVEAQVAAQGIPFHYAPVTPASRAAHFEQVAEYIAHYQADLVVLARYMQILPTALCEKYAGRIINIHHGFLPSFPGGNPYGQAYARGVKLIGATAHYVTADLDDGPIITQDVITINHRQSLADYRRLGEEVERAVLRKAVIAHLKGQVITHQNKTIVFSA